MATATDVISRLSMAAAIAFIGYNADAGRQLGDEAFKSFQQMQHDHHIPSATRNTHGELAKLVSLHERQRASTPQHVPNTCIFTLCCS
jgi:hypothetical protein